MLYVRLMTLFTLLDLCVSSLRNGHAKHPDCGKRPSAKECVPRSFFVRWHLDAFASSFVSRSLQTNGKRVAPKYIDVSGSQQLRQHPRCKFYSIRGTRRCAVSHPAEARKIPSNVCNVSMRTIVYTCRSVRFILLQGPC